jgi:hypothetical protein
LGENNGIRVMFDTPSGSSYLLPEHAYDSASPFPVYQPGQELSFEVDFTRLMAHNASIASGPWNKVLSSIESAQSKLDGTAPPPSSRAEVDSAVEDLDALLERMDMDEARSKPSLRMRRRDAARRSVAFHRQGRLVDIRLARRSLAENEDVVEMDSVKRKRKKKISKHKYKKRRKVSRSSR